MWGGFLVNIIQLPVEKEIAELYQYFPSQEQEKLGLLVGLWMRQMADSTTSIHQLMDAISDQAQARGLSPKILEALLDE